MMRHGCGTDGVEQHSVLCCVATTRPSSCILALAMSTRRAQATGSCAASRLFATSGGLVQHMRRVRHAAFSRADNRGRHTVFGMVSGGFGAMRMQGPRRCCIGDSRAEDPETANPSSWQPLSRLRPRKICCTQNVSDHSNATFAAPPCGAGVVAHVRTIRRGGRRVTP